MKILLISGSARQGSNNKKLIDYFIKEFKEFDLSYFDIFNIPLFADPFSVPPQLAREWIEEIKSADGLLISSPEYLGTIPAALKNSFEWLNKSSILANKKVLPVIFSPKKPRGEKAMSTLVNVLQSLGALILPTSILYHDDFTSVNESLHPKEETFELLSSCMLAFKN